MDVVKQAIMSLGGRVVISSVPGKGTTFSLSLPLTLRHSRRYAYQRRRNNNGHPDFSRL